MTVQGQVRRLTYLRPEEWADKRRTAPAQGPDDAEVQRQRIVDLQARVADLMREALLLRRANLRLRGELGQDLTLEFRAVVSSASAQHGVTVGQIMAKSLGGRTDTATDVILTARNAAISACLEMGGRLDAVAQFFGLAQSRISQIRARNAKLAKARGIDV